MIMERRVYTMRPGNTDAFVQAQIDRGFEIMAPLMQNCVGYFRMIAGPMNQIVHLWAFDDLEDWRSRYNNIYGIAELQPYFQNVRPLMLAQEVEMLTPAPLAVLTPYWGDGRDWRAGDAPIGDLAAQPNTLVAEHTVSLLPGSLPKYWEMLSDSGVSALEPHLDNLLGCFFTLIGPLHQVVYYWRFDDAEDRAARLSRIAADRNWQAFLEGIKPMATGEEARLATPVPIREMSPLFRIS